MLDDVNTRDTWMRRAVIKTIGLTWAMSVFGMLVIACTRLDALHKEYNAINAHQMGMIVDIQNTLNETQGDTNTMDALYEQFEKMYEVAKVVCALQPEYKDYCKLL